MNPELQLLIERSANIYFWLFIIAFVLHALYVYTDEYKKKEKIREKFGKIEANGIPLSNFIAWFLFILSIYYK